MMWPCMVKSRTDTRKRLVRTKHSFVRRYRAEWHLVWHTPPYYSRRTNYNPFIARITEKRAFESESSITCEAVCWEPTSAVHSLLYILLHDCHHAMQYTIVRTFFRPPEVTNSLLALGSCGRAYRGITRNSSEAVWSGKVWNCKSSVREEGWVGQYSILVLQIDRRIRVIYKYALKKEPQHFYDEGKSNLCPSE